MLIIAWTVRSLTVIMSCSSGTRRPRKSRVRSSQSNTLENYFTRVIPNSSSNTQNTRSMGDASGDTSGSSYSVARAGTNVGSSARRLHQSSIVGYLRETEVVDGRSENHIHDSGVHFPGPSDLRTEGLDDLSVDRTILIEQQSLPELKVVQVNLDHTRLAFDSLMHYIKSRNIDVALLQDIQCNGVNKVLPKISGYVRHGNSNVATYIKNGLVHRVLNTHTRFIVVEVLKVVLVNLYLSPNEPYLGVLEQLTNELKTYTSLVLVGDLNCHLPEIERRATYSVRDCEVAEWIEQNRLLVINTPGVHTWSRRSGTQSGVLDYTCFKNIELYNWYVDVRESSHAEHYFIRFKIKLENINEDLLNAAAPPSYITDKEELNTLFGTYIDRLIPTSYTEVDTAASELSTWVVECISKCTQVKEWKQSEIHWWNPQLSKMKRAVNTINWKIRKSKDKTRTEVYHLLSKELRRIYRNMMKSAKEENWRKFISVGRAWGKPYKFIVKAKNYEPVPTVIVRDDGTTSRDYEDTKLSLLNDKFPEAEPIEKVMFESFKTTLMPSEDWVPSITIDEVRQYIKFRNNLSSPGLDKVRWSHVKILFRNIEEYFYNLLVSIVRYASYPECWKEAESVFIPKAGKDSYTKTGDFRPLSKLSCMGKVAESFISKEITRELDRGDSSIDDYQFGFRKGVTSEHALIRVTSEIQSIISEKLFGACISIDIKGAFDHVSHYSVVESMREKGLSENLVAVTADYLSGRSCSHQGVKRHLDRGCPQGSVLGPLLWNISYDSVLRLLREKGLFFACFADDTIVIVKDSDPVRLKAKIREVVQILNEKLLDITLLLNKNKTDIMIINEHRLDSEMREYLSKINIGGVVVDTVPYFKYLGIMLDQKLSFTEHFNYLSHKTSKIVNKLRLVCPNIDGYSNNARRIMYEGTVGAIWKYGSVVFAHRLQLKKNSKIVRKIHRRMLIGCLRAYRTCRYLSLTLIAAWVPFEMEILGRAILAGQKYGWRIEPAPFNVPWEDVCLLNTFELKEKLKRCMLASWEMEWSEVPSESWTKHLFPSVRKALSAPLYSDFYLTQALTGHGVFRAYTNKVNKNVVRDPYCPECVVPETPEHVFTNCPRFIVGRPRGGLTMTAEWLRYFKQTVKALWELEKVKRTTSH